LRRAFSLGPTTTAADLLIRELDAGLDWETATRAVAEGTAEHFGSPVPGVRPTQESATRTNRWAAALFGLALYLVLMPVLSIGRELMVLALAWGVRALVSTGFWKPLIDASRIDPVYAGAAIRSFGSAQPQGVAVSGPLGAVLHAFVPMVFLTPDQTSGGHAFASMVAAPGAGILGRASVAFAADVLLLLFGLLLVSRARGRSWALVIGLLIQAEIVVGHLFLLQVGARDLEATGLPFAIAIVFPSAGWWLTAELASLPEPWQAGMIDAGLIILAYASAFAIRGGVGLLRRLALRRTRFCSSPRTAPVSLRLFLIAVPIAVVVACSPVAALMRGASNWEGAAPNADWSSLSLASAAWPNSPISSNAPHVVSLQQDSTGDWDYLVDGIPEVIRGVGYNPQYASLASSERARLYQRDFSAIRSIGANTIEGWFENQFDELTLDSAARNGLGVILPYELNHDWNYSDATVQQDILGRVSDWVVRYRHHPALRMWAPGNENLHRVLYRNWVSQEQIPEARARAQAFAAFLPRLVDRIHELDPDHPVLYRDAEDVYLPWLEQSFLQPATPRPWLVYGANVYSRARLEEIIAKWPSQWIGGPLVISEFAPAGRGPEARALGYAEDWQRIRTRPGLVLGGLAYAWGTNGPEELDRVFGLVDANGNPPDAALAGLAIAFRKDLAAGMTSPTVVPAPMIGRG
jgi:hypothetical protein